MAQLLVGAVALFAGFFYYKRRKSPPRELILYGVLSLMGLTQLYLLSIDKPFRPTAVIKAIMSLI